MLELKSVAKRFGEFAIKDISFEISGGEYFVLLGPSGVGKTVLIEMIAGLIAVDSGKVIFNGCDVTADPPESRRFAVVYQDFALFDHMTVAKNIAYGLRARGAGSQKANRRDWRGWCSDSVSGTSVNAWGRCWRRPMAAWTHSPKRRMRIWRRLTKSARASPNRSVADSLSPHYRGAQPLKN